MYKKQEYNLLKGLSDNHILYSFCNNRVFIAGGAIRAVFANEQISDYDVYFRNESDRKNFLCDCEDDLEKVFESNNAITFKTKDGKITIQAIILDELLSDSANGIFNEFDFSICMGAYDFLSKEFVLHEKFLEHLSSRELFYNINSKYPIASMARMRKYLKKGYRISGVEIIKLALRINNLKMKTFSDLKEQLEGIDTMFLSELTSILLSDEYGENTYNYNDAMSLLDTSHYPEVFDEQ